MLLPSQLLPCPASQPHGAKVEAVTAPTPPRASNVEEPRRDRTRTAIAPRGASPSSPPGNKRAGPGVQTAHGRTAAGQGQPARPAERHGREARPSPEPCGKGLPGAPTSPAALAGREAPDSSRRRSRPSAAASPPAALYRPPYAHPIGHRRAASAQARASIGQKAS